MHALLQDGWNRFDLVLVVVALVDILVDSVQGSFLRVLRALHRTMGMLRAAGLLRLLNVATVNQPYKLPG
jgi:hypothetical protein